MMARPEHLAHVRTVIAAAAKFPELGRAFFEAGPAYGARRLAGYFQRKTEQGALAIENPERAAWQFLELIQGGKFKALMFRIMDEITREEIAETVEAGVDVFLKAYGAKDAGDRRIADQGATPASPSL